MEQKKHHEQFVSSYIEQNSHTNIKTVPISTQNIITTTKQRDRLHTIFYFKIHAATDKGSSVA